MKRVLDIGIALAALLSLSLPIGLIALLIFLKLGRPLVFAQTRPGLYGKPFRMFKFRTMTNDTDKNGALLPDSQRLTPFGKFLRSTSLDELPELWNVLKGDMSLVGPRPLLMEYLPLYSSEQARRHELRPGITGWAQINGRNALDWEDKFKLDIWYIDNQSLALDIQILIITVKKVLMRKDINPEGEVVVPKFKGRKML